MLGWLKKKAATPEAPAPDEAAGFRIDTQRQALRAAEQRFPIYRVPDRISAWLQEHGWSISLGNDLTNKRWTDLLNMYPAPPRTEQERAEREIHFWKMWLGLHIRTNADGSKGLAPRGEIQQTFKNHETWIFRTFYAATGEYIESSEIKLAMLVAEFFRIWDFIDEEKKKYKTSAPGGEMLSLLGSKASDRDGFIRNQLPDMREKWGGWFRQGIEAAFNREYVKQPAPQNIYGEGGFAKLSDIKGTGQPSGQPALKAQQQTFD